MKLGKKVKRIVALILVMAMTTPVLEGCGNWNKKKSKADGTLTIGIPKNANVTDYETNSYTLWLEEQTGYNLEFQYFSSASTDYKSQISTMIAGGETLPDILWGMDLDPAAYEMYGEDGFFVDLTPYFEDKEKSAVFWDRLSQVYPEDFQQYIRENLAEPDSKKIWAVPTIESTEFDTMKYQVFINQAWLDKLGLPMPTDTDSLYNVLKAFVTKDPNGNGKKDEIGIVGTDNNTGSYNAVSWILNMFVNESRDNYWNVDANGKLYLPYITDEYREGLIYLHKLVKEGLMPKSLFSMTMSDIKGVANPADGVNKAGIIVGHPTIIFTEGQESLYEYAPIKTWGHAVRAEGTFRKNTYITTDCKDVDAAWNLLMTMCTKESAMRQRYGEKGVDWIEADADATSFLGREAELKVLNESAWATGNTLWHAIGATININAEQESRQVDDNTSEWGKWKLELMKTTYENWVAAEEAKPSFLSTQLVMTLEETEETQAERDNCKAWINTMRAKFACGTDNLDPNDDGDWKDYVKKLESYGLSNWQNQAQEIYDRQMAE